MTQPAIERLPRTSWNLSQRVLKGIKVQLHCLVIVIWGRLTDDLLSLRAMGLTYTTLLSLVPLLAVTFSLLKAFGIQNQIEPVLAQALAPLGEQGTEITQYVIGFVDNLKVGLLGAAGVAMLFWTVISLIGRIEDSLNHIWRVYTPRRIGQRFTDYLSVLLVGPVLVFSAFALTASAQSFWVVQRLLEFQTLSHVLVVFTKITPFVFLWLAFTFLYRFMPNTKVQLSSALLGGAVAALLWQVAGALFAIFVASSARTAAIYSSFAILFVFVIWIYVGWLVVLVAAEVAYFHQHPSAYEQESAGIWQTQKFREQMAIRALTIITRRYYAGEVPERPARLASQLGVSISTLDKFVDLFGKHGILVRTVDPEGITLARPPESVGIGDVLQLLNHEQELPVSPREPDSAADEILALRDATVQQALEGMTLKSISEQRNVGEAKS